MVTHREIKKLEAIQNTLREIEKGNLDEKIIKESIKTVDELMELYYEAFIITGMTTQQSWGARDKNNEQYLVNGIKSLDPRRDDYICWKCNCTISNKENEKNKFKGLIS